MRINADFCKLLCMCFDVRMTHSVFGSTTHENRSHYFGVTGKCCLHQLKIFLKIAGGLGSVRIASWGPPFLSCFVPNVQ